MKKMTLKQYLFTMAIEEPQLLSPHAINLQWEEFIFNKRKEALAKKRKGN